MTAQIDARRVENAAPQGPGSGKGLHICAQCGLSVHLSALNAGQWVHDDQSQWEKGPHTARPVEVTPALKFSEKSHRYTLDGKPVQGVTGLIGGGLPKPALVKWAPQLVADYVIDNFPEIQDAYRHNPESLRWDLRKLPEKKRDDAGARGTEVHALGEAIAHGREVEVPERLVPYVEGYARWLDKFDVRPILTERSVASRQHWYAGTFDMIAESSSPKLAPLLMTDLKTSASVYGSTALQVAPYIRAEFYLDGAFERPLPDVDGAIVVHITEEGTKAHWLCRDRDEIDEAFRDFLAVAQVARRVSRIDGRWDSKLRKAVGSYLSDPIEVP